MIWDRKAVKSFFSLSDNNDAIVVILKAYWRTSD